MGVVHHEKTAGGVHLLRFDNPPLGLLDTAMTERLESLLLGIAQDPAARVLILSGAQPDVFVRHFDLAELAQAAEALAQGGADPRAPWHSSIFHRITRLLETMPAIVIAAINGHCMGVGYELALACDLRIASQAECSIGLPEMHIAMMPGGGGTARLARLLGPARALELICTAKTVDAQTALELGMVNSLALDPVAEAISIAGKISSLSASGIAAAKRIVKGAAELHIEDALTLEQREVDRRLGSVEVRAALARYIESAADLRYPVP